MAVKRIFVIAVCVLLTGRCVQPLSAQSLDKPTKALAVSYVGLNVVDLSQTMYGLGRYQVREGNPLLAGLGNHPEAFAALKFGSSATIAWVMWRMREDHPKAAFWYALGANVGMSLVVAHNAKAIR